MGLNLLPSRGATGIMCFGNLAAGEVIITELTAPGPSGQKYGEYGLDLFKAKRYLNGTYILESGSKTLSSGNATAVKQ